MKMRTYATFKEMHGYESTIDELIDRLRLFSRESVLYVCSVTGIILKLWQGNDWARENYASTIDSVFEFIRADWYKFAARIDEAELVFHRRQLLLLMKLAIEHCPENGLDLMKAPRGIFGTMLLMANDQFHFGLFPNPDADDADEYDKISRLVAEFVPVNEYGASAWEYRITRAHLLMTRYAYELRDHIDFIDVAKEYERLSGITLPDYEALTFGLIARITVMITLESLRANAWVAAIRPENFGATSVSRTTIESFMREFASTSKEVLAAIKSAREKEKEFGSNDFTEFRKRPLITEAYGSLAADVNFVIEKFETGPYWRVNYINTATGDRLRRFWGAVFEVYVDALITKCAASSTVRFIPNPHQAGNSNIQVCDGLLIEGDSIVVMEYKASMFTAESKYSGDYIKLRDEISKKLVRDDAENKKKGVEQIAAAITSLFSNPEKEVVSGVDVSKIKRVYPLLITLDDLGSSLLISKLLNFSFDSVFKRDCVTDVEVKPLLCTDIESIEKLLPYLDVKPLSGFLQYWLDDDPHVAKTLLAQFPDGLPERRNEFLAQELKTLKESLGSRLFV
jgi:hypothetical protein